MPRERDRAFTQFFTAIAMVVSGAIVTLTVARPVAPRELPPLTLDARAARSIIAGDQQLAQKQLPQDGRLQELAQLYLDEGESEVPGRTPATRSSSRRRRLTQYTDELVTRHGADVLSVLRARSVERAMQLIENPDEGDERERAGQLGAFPRLMQRYGLVDASWRFRAHPLCVRTALKVRWNLIHGRALTDRLSHLELQAYHGWMALHATSLPPDKRAQAAAQFERAGGVRSREAHAIWLFQSGAAGEAHKAFERLYAERGELRARNMALFAQMAQPLEP